MSSIFDDILAADLDDQDTRTVVDAIIVPKRTEVGSKSVRRAIKAPIKRMIDMDVSAESGAIRSYSDILSNIPNNSISTSDYPLQTISVPEFDASENVLDTDVRIRFKTTPLFDETVLFTEPIGTTNTMSGYIANINFLEESLIKRIIPSPELIRFKCNFGDVAYAGYTPQPKQPKSNRGRKKKPKTKKERKHQGSGDEMNSQITITAVSLNTPIAHVNGKAVFDHSTIRVYKFKVFRTGVLQLPGIKVDELEDMIVCAHRIVAAFRALLQPDEVDPIKMSQLVNLNFVMKNYKFLVKLPPDHKLDLQTLKGIIESRGGEWSGKRTVSFNKEKIKLMAKYRTPTRKNSEKWTLLNVFTSGKINVLGASDVGITAEICRDFESIIHDNWDAVVFSLKNLLMLKPYVPIYNVDDSDVTEAMANFATNYTSAQ